MRVAHRACSRRHESDADKLAIELCIRAGYDPERCLAALEILALVSLDYGDVDGVFGGDHAVILPLNDRIAVVRAHAAAFRSGARVDVERVLADARRRRRHRIAAAAGATAVAMLWLARRSLIGA